MKLKTLFPPAAALFAVIVAATPASAEIVFLSSGRTLSVTAHRLDGDNIVLTLRSGGEVTCKKDLITKIDPDEVPYIDPDAPKAPEPANATDPEQEGNLLEGTPYAEIIAAASEAQGV